MWKKRMEIILVVYGKGGHAAQMQRFIEGSPESFSSRNFVALTDVKKVNKHFIEQFFCIEARNKYSHFTSIFVFLAHILFASLQMIRIMAKYKVLAVVSTGPGIAIIPSLISRLLSIDVVYFESWSRVCTPSIAGRVMYFIASTYFIQHEPLKKHYPKGIYAGRL